MIYNLLGYGGIFLLIEQVSILRNLDIKMKEKEISQTIQELKSLKEKFRYHQINIDILKESYWDPYDHFYIDKDIWERQKIEEIKCQGQILKTLEEEIKNIKKHIKELNREQNKRNNLSYVYESKR